MQKKRRKKPSITTKPPKSPVDPVQQKKNNQQGMKKMDAEGGNQGLAVDSPLVILDRTLDTIRPVVPNGHDEGGES